MKTRAEVLGANLDKHRKKYSANVARITEDKVLLTKVTDLETNETFDHAWVTRSRFERDEGIKNHFKVTFTAQVTEYLGIDKDCKQVTKLGLCKVGQVIYKYKLRRNQR